MGAMKGCEAVGVSSCQQVRPTLLWEVGEGVRVEEGVMVWCGGVVGGGKCVVRGCEGGGTGVRGFRKLARGGTLLLSATTMSMRWMAATLPTVTPFLPLRQLNCRRNCAGRYGLLTDAGAHGSPATG